MHNREALSIKRLWQSICDYDMWPLYIMYALIYVRGSIITEKERHSGLLFGIPASPPGSYLTLSLRNLGFSTITTNLLTIPSTIGHMVTMAGITLISENYNDRSFISMSEDLWMLPFLIALRTLPNGVNPWKFYVGLLIPSF